MSKIRYKLGVKVNPDDKALFCLKGSRKASRKRGHSDRIFKADSGGFKIGKIIGTFIPSLMPLP